MHKHTRVFIPSLAGGKKAETPQRSWRSTEKRSYLSFHFVPILGGTCRVVLELEADAVDPGGSLDCAKLPVKLNLSPSISPNLSFYLGPSELYTSQAN